MSARDKPDIYIRNHFFYMYIAKIYAEYFHRLGKLIFDELISIILIKLILTFYSNKNITYNFFLKSKKKLLYITKE